MIVMTAEFQAKSGCELELESILRTLIAPTRGEAGTLNYSLNRVREQPGRFIFCERYRDQAGLDLHLGGPALKAVLGRIEALLAEPPRVLIGDELDAITAGHMEDRYYLIESLFQQPFETFGEAVPAHREWLQGFYDQGVMLCSGPKADRSGGVIFARAPNAAPLEAFIEGDPYFKAGLAKYKLVEFSATKKGRELE